ncbi:CDP-alcohol phosphatidyltransferase family protein [Aeromicrobium sp. YIM 150415]|uniref:CDP-diacylglycerol--glycerol-3-phosphate 3-phosphatidyltransferase n=1 Tax=Aeromicrobium piscarium TaxID=2590901 RepID=A0A554SGB5_9ACTN|nr:MULTISPECIES: CDP-alcohol phosphatidyltransferase family protein [Aeromicrobium]MBM9462710.1 CDP-alcohol phosphatidyltransferase family protein [Aeromicrobium sp. YIM 150415]TSD65384.1 CDP-diacylglycerol--glycerol-3-phosphate 3-phosphatidyltransferase [Aeromicrobium piscarium]
MTEKDAAPSNLNIANVLTVIRILGVPLFGWLLLIDGGQDEWLRVWSWVAFVLLMATDKIDGDLARKHGLITDFGKIADPIADKALTGMAFVGLAIIFDHWLFWTVTILMLVREWGITVMRFFMVRRGVVMPASRGGKLKTVLQAFAIAGYLLPFELWDNLVSDLLRWVTHGVMAATVVVTVVTGVQYVVEARRLSRTPAR